MKLNKDNLQKIFLVVVLALAGVYFYFSEILGPLSVREAAAKDAISALEPKMKDAKTQINRTRSIEAGDSNAATAKEIFSVMKASIPDGPPVAWYQPRLSDFFKRQGIPKATCRWTSDAAEPDLPGYKNCFWTIDLPRIEFAALAATLARLENQEGLLQITNLQIEAMPMPDVQYQHAQLSVSTLVKESK
jgi:hypothetical protein